MHVFKTNFAVKTILSQGCLNSSLYFESNIYAHFHVVAKNAVNIS